MPEQTELTPEQIRCGEKAYELSRLPGMREKMRAEFDRVCLAPPGTRFPTDGMDRDGNIFDWKEWLTEGDRLAVFAAMVDEWRKPNNYIGPRIKDALESVKAGEWQYALFRNRLWRLSPVDVQWIETELDAAISRAAPGVGSVVPGADEPPAEQTQSNLNRRKAHEVIGREQDAPLWNDWGDYAFNSSFTTVDWFGERHQFNVGQQANAIGQLLAAYEHGRCGLTQNVLAGKLGSSDDRFRLDKVFEAHPAWNTIIKRTETGEFRLVEGKSAASKDAP